MSKLVVRSFSVSLDGFGAGPDQSLENPMGAGGMPLHDWAFATKTFRTMFGKEDGETGLDESFAARGFENLGAWILGRNMFGPVRGAWPNEDWKGWWGDEPPYHVPVFVLTHYPRKPLEMAGGTTFFFITDGVRAALDRARAAANGKDIRVGGGADTIRQYLEAGLMDEMHLAVSPVLLGRGESLYAGLDLPALGYEVAESRAGERATHIVVRRA
ncbi:MAG: dihydrofolate reductase family protein [Rhizobiaceae bacterium]